MSLDPKYVDRVVKVLQVGKQFLYGLSDGEQVALAGGAFGDLAHDTELKADKALGEFLAGVLMRQFPEAHTITVEGMAEPLMGSSSGHLWITVDPIDGSLNYKDRGFTNGFPYTAVITVLNTFLSEQVRFRDVVAAGVIDLRRDVQDLWYAGLTLEDSRLAVTHVQSGLGSMPAKTMEHEMLDLGRMNILGEMYYPDNRDKMVRAFSDMKGWLRSPGSAAYEMASVASGQAAACICNQQKQHELGAGYLLVRGAGGVAVDWYGNDLGSRLYDFTTQVPMILAANRRIADQILERLNRS